tara:strand:- start:311 stop:553 length:243 start_codon:yes stop_codon:yes gene_type:complete
MALGDIYLGKFKAGDYVKWRNIVRDRNYEASTREYYGLVMSLYEITDEYARPVHYAKILENNSGSIFHVLLHKIQKVETN